MTLLVRWIFYFRYSALLKMNNTGVMLNRFLRKLQEASEGRYDGPIFYLSILSMLFTYDLDYKTDVCYLF